MLEIQQSVRQRPATAFHPAISMTDEGLVCGAGSTLVRMARTGSGLLVEDDAGRLIAMLSAAFSRRMSSAEIVPHVRAAAETLVSRRQGCRQLPLDLRAAPATAKHGGRRATPPRRIRARPRARARRPDEGARLRRAIVEKYWEDQPRVPAGCGIESGRWTSDPALKPSAETPTRVAEELPEEDEKEYETRHLEGATSRQEDIDHGRSGLLDTPGMPRGIGAGPYAGEPIPAGAQGPKATAAQRRRVQADFEKYGCHDCGTFDAGTKSGNAIPYHQKPTALVQPGEQQYFYPHCLACSLEQGGRVRAFKYRKE